MREKATIDIGGQSIEKSGYLDKIQSYLHEVGIETQQSKALKTIHRKKLEEFQPDLLFLPAADLRLIKRSFYREYEKNLHAAYNGDKISF